MSEHEINKYERFVNDYLKHSIISEIVDFDMENEHKTVSKLLNDKELNNVKGKLLDFLERYPENKSQNDLKCEKIIMLRNKFVDLQQHFNAILSLKEWERIANYLESIVNNDETERINRVCDLIDNSPNGIDRTLVDSLLQLVLECGKSQQPIEPMKLMDSMEQVAQKMEQLIEQQWEQMKQLKGRQIKPMESLKRSGSLMKPMELQIKSMESKQLMKSTEPTERQMKSMEQQTPPLANNVPEQQI